LVNFHLEDKVTRVLFGLVLNIFASGRVPSQSVRVGLSAAIPDQSVRGFPLLSLTQTHLCIFFTPDEIGGGIQPAPAVARRIEAESPQRSEDLERKARPTGARPKIPRPQSRTPPLQGGETPMLQGSIGAGSQLYKS